MSNAHASPRRVRFTHFVYAEDVVDRLEHLIAYGRNTDKGEGWEEALMMLGDALYGFCHEKFAINKAEP